MLNNVNLCGRITATPELRKTPTDLSVTTFTLAVDRNYSGDNQADFITVVAWKQTADFICKYWTKGKMMILNGRLQTRTYTDKDGKNRSVMEVVANNVFFAGDKQTTVTEENKPQNTTFEPMTPDSDLPF